ncbi:Uu.00g089200.m01.CDS01 [Anthostomella pinea]|uniref:Uu.00g089200.m01.CDS01 n=1 Tax=Anthostomella pinea TaxID=933095 RepID=A0AAI8VMM8_9PEZI|nr:Uu.00g089200.m01.CDS01 [Anthostomella pinea]
MVEGVDIQKFLQTGYWPSSRARSPDSRFSDSNSPSNESFHIDPTAPRRLPFKVALPVHNRHYQPPPPPSVEDESEALAKEYGSVVSTPSEEPPYRGEPDQDPILLPVHEYNPERRFVLVSNASGSSDESSGSEKKPPRRPRSKERRAEPEPTPYEANTGRKYVAPTPRGDETAKKREARPARERRRSRMDELPPIITGAEPETRPRDVRRAKSTTRADVRGEDYFSPRLTSLSSRFQGESTLSPDVTEHATHGRDRSYYNGGLSPNTQRRNRSAHPDQQHSRNLPNDHKHKDSSLQLGQPISPTFQKRHTGDIPRQTRRPSKSGHEMRRQYSDMPAPKLSRKCSTSSHAQSERDSASLKSASPREKRHSPHYNDTFHSSDEEQRPRLDTRRRKSALPTERTEYLGTPTETKTADRRKSRGVSPLPSPRVSQNSHNESYSSSSSPRSSTFPRDLRAPREEDRPERPLSRASTARSVLNAAAPILVPAVVAAATAAASESGSPIDHRRSTVPPPPKAATKVDIRSPASAMPSPSPSTRTWQPPKFEPSRNGADVGKPITSYRRYSLDTQSGELPDIGHHCPRTREEAGHMDWLTLPRCDNFNICPSCYNSNFANTEFAHHFVMPPIRPRDRPLACDFGTSQYYRIAWLFTRKYKKPDLSLFMSIAKIGAQNTPCTGHREASRIWYSVKDPRSKRPLQEFNVCHSCAKTIEVLLPNLTGLFVPMDSPAEPTRGVCALRQQNDRQHERGRFVQYFDVLETTADHALVTRSPPNVQVLVERLRRHMEIPECANGRERHGQKWHTMRSIPDFTVCEECFGEVVRPLVNGDDERALPIAGNFHHESVRIPVAACQLYSSRMRAFFARAIQRRDLGYLDAKVRERLDKEQEFHDKVAALDRVPRGTSWVDAEAEKIDREWRRWE